MFFDRIVLCLGFCSIVWLFAPENVSGKFSSRQVCCFWGLFFFSLVFRRRRRLFVSVFCSREKAQVVTGHPHTRLFGFVFFLFESPPRLVYRPFWLCVLSFPRFVGVPFWAPGVLAIFGFSQYLGGLEITRPLLRPFFLDARRQGCSSASSAWLLCSSFAKLGRRQKLPFSRKLVKA